MLKTVWGKECRSYLYRLRSRTARYSNLMFLTFFFLFFLTVKFGIIPGFCCWESDGRGRVRCSP